MSENLSIATPSLDPSLIAGNSTDMSQEAPYRLIQDGKVYDELKDGQAVNIAALGNIFIQIDEENLGLERVTLENLEKCWETQGESFTKGLQERGIEADPFTVFKWYQIQRKVFQTLL